MTRFTMMLAGVPFAVEANYDTTERFASEYLTDQAPRFTVSVTADDLAQERRMSEEEDRREGIPVRRFSDNYLETLALYRALSAPMLDYDAVVFHGSVVALDGKAYLFTAPSGTGKTTHTRLWLDNIPGSYVLNGDKPLLRVTENGVFACGTPWRGKERYGVNEMLPLDAICLLERAETNTIRPIGAAEAVDALLRQTNMQRDAAGMVKTLSILDRIASAVRLYRLRCNMDGEAALVCRDGIVI